MLAQTSSSITIKVTVIFDLLIVRKARKAHHCRESNISFVYTLHLFAQFMTPQFYFHCRQKYIVFLDRHSRHDLCRPPFINGAKSLAEQVILELAFA